jgi:Amt family ammonium transporter
MAGLMAALIVGNRRGYIPASDSLPPHNILLTVMGASLMWVGWLGFNAGSAYSSGERASYAALATQICASTSSLMWLSVETIIKKKPSVIGLVNGAISGLVVITPAAGFVDMNGAFWMGFFGGPLCYFGSQFKHTIFGVDDALDAFGIHAWGGMIGGICVGFFAMDAVSEEPAAIDGVYSGSTRHGGHLLAYQIAAVLFSVVYAGFGSFVILKVMDMIMGLRADGDLIREEQGLDASLHDDAVPAKEAELENDVPPPLAEPATQA